MEFKRVCVIGAGPSGMSALFHFARLEQYPEIVCYEKQNTWGGLWNLSWRTGLDEYGEPNHDSMYKYLWMNGMKEFSEYPDYTYEKHFGQVTPSYPPRPVVRDYLEGRFTKGAATDLKRFIRFHTAVKFVKYLDSEKKFVVTVADLKTGETTEGFFSHVIVATGIYSTPNMPEFPGMDIFEGRVLHSLDLRDVREVTDRSVLLIGAGYSGEDIALQCVKFGMKRVIISHRSIPKSTTCKMPDGVEEKPIVERFSRNMAHFSDGSSAEVNCVIFCTGYQNHYPFLEGRLRISPTTHNYPKNLYKASMFLKAGDNRLFYIGALNQLYTLMYFEVIAAWVVRFVTESIADEPRPHAEMEQDSEQWHQRANKLQNEKEVLLFQTDLIEHLADITGYTKEILKGKELFLDWMRVRKETLGLANYRDASYSSIYTGTQAPKQTPFMENFDESIDAFLKWNKPNDSSEQRE